MPHKHHKPPALRSWLSALFQQPSPFFYHRPAIYLCGSFLEIEHFRSILQYDSSRLCLRFPRGIFTVYGDELQILMLTADRITLRGRILRTDFSDDQEIFL